MKTTQQPPTLENQILLLNQQLIELHKAQEATMAWMITLARPSSPQPSAQLVKEMNELLKSVKSSREILDAYFNAVLMQSRAKPAKKSR